MSFKKIPKEVWLKLTNEEREFHTNEFNEDVEKRKKWTIISTRILALLCIGVLLFMGVAQFEGAKNYNAIVDEYGANGFCYLCGQASLKKCECQYYKTHDYGNFKMPEPNISKISKELAEYNVETCKPYDWYFQEEQDEFIDSINKGNFSFSN